MVISFFVAVAAKHVKGIANAVADSFQGRIEVMYFNEKRSENVPNHIEIFSEVFQTCAFTFVGLYQLLCFIVYRISSLMMKKS